jgi:hypothetical protein
MLSTTIKAEQMGVELKAESKTLLHLQTRSTEPWWINRPHNT